MNTDDFIRKAVNKHGDKYDYSKSIYTGTNNKISIICKEHGDFEQRSSAHLGGQGCMKCRLENRRTGLDEFLKRSTDIHVDRYDYSLVNEYKNSNTKVDIICKRHGIFKISPHKHLYGQGCAECKKLGIDGFLERLIEYIVIDMITHWLNI